MAAGTYYRFFTKKKERAPISYLDSGTVGTGYHETVRRGPGVSAATGYDGGGGNQSGSSGNRGRLRALVKAKGKSTFFLGYK